MTQLVNKLFSTHLIYLYVLNGFLTFGTLELEITVSSTSNTMEVKGILFHAFNTRKDI